MNKRAEAGKRILMIFLVATMFLFTVRYSQSAIVSCEYDPTSILCDNGGTKVLGMYNSTNAHIELWNSSVYDPGICCKDIGAGNLTVNLTYGVNYLDISSITNAHAEEGGSGNYPYNLIFGFTNGVTLCEVINTSVNCSDAGYDDCVVRLSNLTNAHVEACDESNYPYQVCCDLRYDIDPGWSNITFPEGIYTIEPPAAPGAGTYRYGFNITFHNLTASDGDIIGCVVQESNCHDAQLPGCTQIFVNKTVTGGSWYTDFTINHTLKDTDSVNTTQGGQTSQWIPWEIVNCSIINNWNGTYYKQNTTWRVHVHGTTWETGDIARANNCYNGLSNEYFKNTIMCDALGDVTFASSMYSGTKVEKWCHNGVDDDDPDSTADCSDTECWGITYSCIDKQDLQNSSLYYSPSGSHGTLANDIKDGDLESTTSSSQTLNTRIEWTQHTNPNGTFKIRFYRWDMNRVATITVDGLPEIKEVNKYAAGSDESTGLVEYFKANTLGEPTVKVDRLDQGANKTYPNKFVMKSFTASQQITNMDTTVNVSFLNPGMINLTEGYNVTVTLAYCQGATCYNDYITIPVYFDEDNFTSMNEHENDIFIDGVSWGVCNDTKNADFDYLGGIPQYSFDQQSYDCYDMDCDNYPGTPAWNAYLGQNTAGDCEYTGELTCYDSYNNDWHLEDLQLGHDNTDGAVMLPDCRDDECHLQQGNETNAAHLCNYNREANCSDGFDNDQYQSYDCIADTAQAGGSYEYWEYDCQSYCRSTGANNITSTETGDQCFDGIDNDMDRFVFTTDNSSFGQTALNDTYGAGMDCQYYETPGSIAADEDCNLSVNSSNGFRCELGHELSCTDGFDNDMDLTNATGWSGSYDGYVIHDTGADCSDYDCSHIIDANGNFFNSEEGEFYACPLKEYSPDGSDGFYQGNSSWCFDGIDNDLDGIFDCQDIDCIYAVHPDDPDIVCYPQEFNLTLGFQVCNNYYSGQPFDDDGDSDANCGDADCKQKFGFCGPCPTYENITWDSCADDSDNDGDGSVDCADPDCDSELGDHDGHFCELNTEATCDDGFDNDRDGSVDCADPDCNGVGICESTESSCNDDVDNDGDGNVDCADVNCAATCNLTSMMGAEFFPHTSTSTWGSAQVSYDDRVRVGDNYSVRVNYGSSYRSATVTIGNLAAGKKGLPLSEGLDAPNFALVGPDAADFETTSYSEDAPPTKGQVVVIDSDHTTITYPPFDITAEIPTDDTMPYRDFEYIHSILKGDSSLDNIQNQFLDVYILDDVVPYVYDIDTEPGDKELIEYDGSFWISVNAVDPSNSKLPGAYDGRIYRCYFNISGPGYIQGYTADTDCLRTYDNIVEDGTYTVNVYPVDSTGNIGSAEERNYNIDLIPKYVDQSFNLSRQFFNATLNDTVVSAKFYTDDAASISSCNVYAMDSVGTDSLLGAINASNSGDLLTCNGSVTLPVTDEMYNIYVEIEDNEGDKVNSTKETFYVCNNFSSSGPGWRCSKADFDQDGWTEGIIEDTYGVDRACDMCPGIENLGLDIDADGVDDACDTPYLRIIIPDQQWPEDTNHTLNLSIYFDDIDGDDLNYTFTPVANIDVSIDNDTGIATFVPDIHFNGVRFITFYAFDKYGKNGTSNNVRLTVGSVNNPPYLAQNISNITWAEDTNATINLSQYFADYDYDDLNYTSTQPENITVIIDNATDIATLIPDTEFYGINNITFYAFDNSSDNASSDNVILNVTYVNDLPSAVMLISPVDGYNTTDMTPSFNWSNSSDIEGHAITYYLQISDDNFTTYEIYQNTTSTEYTLLQNLSNGAWLWRVAACDNGSSTDNCSYSSNRTIRIDTNPPSITIESPAEGSVVGWNVSLETTITDTTMVDSAWYEIINSSGYMEESGALIEANGYDSNWMTNSSIADGNYTFKVYANDTLGQLNITNTTFLLDNSKPHITFNIPYESYHGASFNMSVLLQSGLLAKSDYNITNSSGALIQNNSLVLSSSSYTWQDLLNLSLYDEGNYTFTVYAEDNVGNNDTKQTWFVVDKTYPGYFNLSYAPSTVHNNDTFVVNITWIDDINISAVYLEHNANGSLVNYSAVYLGNNSYSASIDSSLLDNNEDIDWKIIGIDLANNVNSTAVESFTVQNRNPVVQTIPTISWNEDTTYMRNLSLYFSDPDNDDLNFTSTFTANINISIDNDTGVANLTPAANWHGTETVVFTAYDMFGADVDSNIVTLKVLNTADCGDGKCESEESYTSCPADCPAPPSPPRRTVCSEEWACDAWSKCSTEGTRTRECYDLNYCSDKYDKHIVDIVYEAKKPKDKEDCEYEPTCDDGILNGNEIDVDCGGLCGACSAGQGCRVDEDCITRFCIYDRCVQANCSDGIQNLDESGVDCGGDCDPCPTCDDGIQNQNETGIDCGGQCQICGPRAEEPTLIDVIRGREVEKINLTLFINQSSLIKFKGENYYLDLFEINPNNVRIRVRQTGQEIRIKIGYVNYTDLDVDGTDDLAIRLDSLTPTRAKLNITLYRPSYILEVLLLTALISYLIWYLGKKLNVVDMVEYLLEGQKKIRKEAIRVKRILSKRRRVRAEDVNKLKDINRKLEKIKRSLRKERIKSKEEFKKELEEVEKLTAIKRLEKNLIDAKEELHHVKHPRKIRKIKDLASSIMYAKGLWDGILKSAGTREKELTEDIERIKEEIKKAEKPREIKIEEVYPVEKIIRHRKTKFEKLDEQISDIDKELEKLRHVVLPTPVSIRRPRDVRVEAPMPVIKRKGLKKLDKQLASIDKELEELRHPPKIKAKRARKAVKEVVKKVKEAIEPREKTTEERKLDKKITDIDREIAEIGKEFVVEEIFRRRPVREFARRAIKEAEPREKTAAEKRLEKSIAGIDEQLKELKKPVVEEEIRPKRKPIRKIIREAIVKAVERKKTREERRLEKEISDLDKKLESMKGVPAEAEVKPKVKRKRTVKQLIKKLIIPVKKHHGLKKLDKQISRIDNELKRIREAPDVKIKPKVKEKRSVKEIIRKLVRPRIRKTKQDERLEKEISELDKKLAGMRGVPAEVDEVRPRLKKVVEKIKKDEVKKAEEKIREKSRVEKRLEREISELDKKLESMKGVPAEAEVRPKVKEKRSVKEIIRKIVSPRVKKTKQEKRLERKISEIDEIIRRVREAPEVEKKVVSRKKAVVIEKLKEEPKVREKSRVEKRLEKEISELDKKLESMKGVPAEAEVRPKVKEKRSVKEIIRKIVSPRVKKTKQEKRLERKISEIDEIIRRVREAPEVEGKFRRRPVGDFVRRIVNPSPRRPSKKEMDIDRQIAEIDEELSRMKHLNDKEDLGIYRVLQRRRDKVRKRR